MDEDNIQNIMDRNNIIKEKIFVGEDVYMVYTVC